jgi:1-acyl-sn-glycerol-3-phosphate acyltransferase
MGEKTEEKPPFPWRGALFFLPVMLITLSTATVVALGATLSTSFRRRGYVPWVRRWGRFPLWLLGVRLEVQGLENRDAPGAKLLLFNHVSALDVLILASVCPERAMVVYKKEFHRIPGLGWALSSMGMIAIDRRDRASAIESVTRVGKSIREGQFAVMMAPEGTRSRQGGLQPFKLGPFHLAARTGVPIVPLVMRGIETVMPMSSRFSRPGVVRVDFLAPVETGSWGRRDVRERAEEVREVFLRYLPAVAEREATGT